mmetsp:Transcript_2640/g.7245  ORF Transcript_2640/g.7245 Transcript_2640/m.7245 type:complete len:202 (+) Transcript_2640:591-1196(+)
MPVAVSELLDVCVGCPKAGKTNFLRKVGKVAVCEHGSMPQQLVTNIGLRSVQRFGMVTDVLGGKEDSECETIQEIPRRKQPGHWSHAESCVLQQKVANILLLRNGIAVVAAVFLHQIKRRLVFLASILIPQRFHLIPYGSPRGDLLIAVLGVIDGRIPRIRFRSRSELLSATAVFHVREARMVALQFIASVQRPMRNQVQL